MPVFRWYGFPQCAEGQDLQTAVDVLLASISGEGRVWNPWSRSMAGAEFRQRLQKAASGKLTPVDEVKPVDVRNPPPLYEIRWQGISVTNRAADGALSYSKVIVRLYHSEPPEAPDHFIGHHAHEKDVSADDVNEVQDSEIKVALGWHAHGLDRRWDIQRLQQEQ